MHIFTLSTYNATSLVSKLNFLNILILIYLKHYTNITIHSKKNIFTLLLANRNKLCKNKIIQVRQDFSQGGGVNLGGLNWDSSGLQREHIDFKEYKRNFKAKGILFFFIMGACYSLNLHVIYVAHWSLNSVLYIHSPWLPPHPPLIYNFMSGRL